MQLKQKLKHKKELSMIKKVLKDHGNRVKKLTKKYPKLKELSSFTETWYKQTLEGVVK